MPTWTCSYHRWRKSLPVLRLSCHQSPNRSSRNASSPHSETRAGPLHSGKPRLRMANPGTSDRGMTTEYTDIYISWCVQLSLCNCFLTNWISFPANWRKKALFWALFLCIFSNMLKHVADGLSWSRCVQNWILLYHLNKFSWLWIQVQISTTWGLDGWFCAAQLAHKPGVDCWCSADSRFVLLKGLYWWTDHVHIHLQNCWISGQINFCLKHRCNDEIHIGAWFFNIYPLQLIQFQGS